MSRKSANDRVYSLTWSPDDGEDVPKRFSTPNYLQFAPNLVKIGAGSPELQKLECFEEHEEKFSKRPRPELRVVAGRRRGRAQTVQHPQLPAVWSKLGQKRTQDSRVTKT